MQLSDKDLKRFWDKVKISSPNECWNWIGLKSPRGYGHFKYKNKHNRANRLSLMLIEEPPTPKHECLHSCDNPSCVNPNHLRWGTHSENLGEMKVRNKIWQKNVREAHRRRRTLSDEQVLDIKSNLAIYGKSAVVLMAKKHNTKWQIINFIFKGDTYKDIDINSDKITINY